MNKAGKMRTARNDTYQIKDPIMNQELPQFINVHQFIASRSLELNHFTKILKTKLTTKLQH